MKFFASCSILLLALGCNGTEIAGDLHSAMFKYEAFDSTGTRIVSGWITLSIQDSSHITGEWHCSREGMASGIGPQVGQGNLVGSFSGKMLGVNFNPHFVDNNVFLHGTFDGRVYEGRWNWSGYPGIINSGTFRAVRR